MSSAYLKSFFLNVLGKCTSEKMLKYVTSKVAFNPPKTGPLKDDFDEKEPTAVFKKIMDESVVYDPNFAPNETIVETNFRLIDGKKNFKDICFVLVQVLKYPGAKTIFYSHGNAIDIGIEYDFYVDLAIKLQCNVFAYDYSGYGLSKGHPSEDNLYEDSNLMFTYLIEYCDFFFVEQKNIILFGDSIGTVPTIYLGSKYHVAGVILISPLKSGLELAFPSCDVKSFRYNPFPNFDRVDKINAPVLVIHGKKDDTVPFDHGMAIYQKCQRPSEPLWTEDGHNINVLEEPYLERLKAFIKELENGTGSNSAESLSVEKEK